MVYELTSVEKKVPHEHYVRPTEFRDGFVVTVPIDGITTGVASDCNGS